MYEYMYEYMYDTYVAMYIGFNVIKQQTHDLHMTLPLPKHLLALRYLRLFK